jgi:hypothetical protein
MLIQIKTKEQLKETVSWNEEKDKPKLWNPKGKMDYLMGREVDAIHAKGYWLIPTKDNGNIGYWSVLNNCVVTEVPDADTN